MGYLGIISLVLGVIIGLIIIAQFFKKYRENCQNVNKFLLIFLSLLITSITIFWFFKEIKIFTKLISLIFIFLGFLSFKFFEVKLLDKIILIILLVTSYVPLLVLDKGSGLGDAIGIILILVLFYLLFTIWFLIKMHFYLKSSEYFYLIKGGEIAVLIEIILTIVLIPLGTFSILPGMGGEFPYWVLPILPGILIAEFFTDDSFRQILLTLIISPSLYFFIGVIIMVIKRTIKPNKSKTASSESPLR